MLLTQAAPRARKMLEALTGMIDAEDTLAANRSRKSLLKALADSRGSFATGLASIRAYLLSGDVKFIKDFNNRWETNSSRFSTIKNSRNIFSSEQVKFFKIYESVRQEFEQLPDEMFRIRGSDKWNQGIWLLGNEAAPRGARAIIIINGMIIGQEKLMLNDVNTLKSESNSLVNIVIIVAVIGLIFGIIIAWSNIVSITKPLKRVISNLSEGSDIVVNASEVVSSGAQSLAEDASSQAAAIEETSSSIEEMAAMTKNNAANASEANSLMKNAKQIVSDANDSMGNLTGSMEEISKASEETSKIIKTIDEIAFQTNLLALNAAVEAARAGEAGAGFAVVADEVRNLALRAADAAKNTASLIEGTVKKINDGSILVTETNEAFEKMAENTGKVGGIVGEITAASSEQAEGISQINKAIAQMDSIVQRNAASAEESASGSEELSAQAAEIKVSVEDLKGMIGSIEDRQQQAIKLYGQPDDKNVQQKIFATKKELVKAKEISPEQVIPMHDDDFEDF
ncbi:MAG: hypothetical protein GY760_04935 [Deltaproteobacteria bacterium]|nr:hypothetical protein [Deltaproteobacteria bacterium]